MQGLLSGDTYYSPRSSDLEYRVADEKLKRIQVHHTGGIEDVLVSSAED